MYGCVSAAPPKRAHEVLVGFHANESGRRRRRRRGQRRLTCTVDSTPCPSRWFLNAVDCFLAIHAIPRLSAVGHGLLHKCQANQSSIVPLSPMTTHRPCNAYLNTQVVSPLLFPSSRHENRAVQAVEVRGAPRSALRAPSGSDGGGGQTSSGGSHGHGYGGAAGGGLRSYTFTFCLERVLEGPLKVGASVACWVVVLPLVPVICGDSSVTVNCYPSLPAGGGGA